MCPPVDHRDAPVRNEASSEASKVAMSASGGNEG